MHYCTECQTVEGSFRPITSQEFIDHMGDDKDFVEESGDDEDQVCNECDSYGSKVNVPEHDWNEER
jgi:hypothetical protein